MMHVLIIDNYDSFTFNIKANFQVLGATVTVKKNDAITLADINALQPTHIVISPGPGRPEAAGISQAVIKHLHHLYPILGVCLGHQCIASVWGGNIVSAPEVMHGKRSSIYHHNRGLFQDLPDAFLITRYHSLVIDEASLSTALCVDAWSFSAGRKKLIMAIRHRKYPVFGLQYHPEAILTEHGSAVFDAFLSSQPVS